MNIPIIARSRLGDPDLDADILAKGQADAIMLSRPSLADPDYPNKVLSGETEKIRPCIGCNMACIGRCLETQTHESCAVNPRACYETSHPAKTSKDPKKIAVVGGGIAGMQACITACECGHSPELFEKSSVLGGELNSAGAHEFKVDIHRARGATSIVEATGHSEMCVEACKCLGRHGTLYFAAVYHEPFPFLPNMIVNGTYRHDGMGDWESIPNIERLMKLTAEGIFPVEKIVTYYDFEDMDKALDDLAHQRVIKPVLKNVN